MRRLALAFAAFTLLLAGRAVAEPLKIVASFSILGDMTRNVAGPDADIHVLVGPDGDAHVFEPAPTDLSAVAGADVLIVNGLGFEGFMDRLTGAAEFKGRLVVASEGIVVRSDEHGLDPHAWQSLANAQIYVGNIVVALSAADPANAAAYEERGRAYSAAIADLDARMRERIEAVPVERRRILTSHDAFGYFADAYGVEFVAISGISNDAEASAGALAHLIDEVRNAQVSALFVENITDPRLTAQISGETGVAVGGTLYSDALSPPDGPAPTYVAMIEHNVAELVAAMGSD